jgi:flavodoxin
MKALVLYDSLYGNTERIAQAITAALGPDATAVSLAGFQPEQFGGTDLLVVGSPTQGGRPTAGLKKFFDGLPPDALRAVRVAAFDTRFAPADHGVGLRLVIRIFGFAAPRIAKTLERKGGVLVVPPEGFSVLDKEGPLRDGELERAAAWARALVAAVGPRAAA